LTASARPAVERLHRQEIQRRDALPGLGERHVRVVLPADHVQVGAGHLAAQLPESASVCMSLAPSVSIACPAIASSIGSRTKRIHIDNEQSEIPAFFSVPLKWLTPPSSSPLKPPRATLPQACSRYVSSRLGTSSAGYEWEMRCAADPAACHCQSRRAGYACNDRGGGAERGW